MKRFTYISLLFLSIFVISCICIELSAVKPSITKYNVNTTSKTEAVSISESSAYATAIVSSQKEVVKETSDELVETEISIEPIAPISCYIELTEDETQDLATLVYLESGTESYECQLAVASVVINRMITSNKSLYDVIYEKNQFTPANLITNNKPSESTMNAVNEVCTNGPIIPEYVTYFRADRYHSFSEYIRDYMCIDNTYFSYDINLKSSICKD